MLDSRVGCWRCGFLLVRTYNIYVLLCGLWLFVPDALEEAFDDEGEQEDDDEDVETEEDM